MIFFISIFSLAYEYTNFLVIPIVGHCKYSKNPGCLAKYIFILRYDLQTGNLLSFFLSNMKKKRERNVIFCIDTA
ncbi:hypothetical protein C1646_694367 [Rhizophagus diaphanus]|nr:hypothetical protein C1646_694367 [Rhizophagus diaphanus] [Rhizophagus sp. MUCL 43196]